MDIWRFSGTKVPMGVWHAEIDVRTQNERSGSEADMNDRYSLLHGGQDGIRPWVGRLKMPPERWE
jgi:hypothetical protein